MSGRWGMDSIVIDDSSVAGLLRSLRRHSPATAQHCVRVAAYGARTARAIGLAAPCVQLVHLAGLLHDVGKLGVDTAILNKPGALTAGEWEIMKQHPAIGVAMLCRVPALAPLVPVVAYHHERFDGTGYPSGLAGSRIPLEARIIAVCDAYDSITVDRPYRPGTSSTEGAARLLQGAGTQFDPVVVHHFIDAVLPHSQERTA